MAVIDCFTFNGENTILKLHLNILWDYVDKFVIVEANKTFTGLPKPYYLLRDYRYFKQWWSKIEYYTIDEWADIVLWKQAINSPNTRGADHWAREFYIKENIQKALKQAKVKDEDVVFIGDVDEIVDPTVKFETDKPIKAKLRVYAYWLNNRSDEKFWGTLIAQYKDIKNECLNHLRSDKSLYSKGLYLGWHFTSMGGLEEVRRKLDHSYTMESYNTPKVQELLADRIEKGMDYLGRDFKFKLDETEHPKWLKDNKEKFLAFYK